jgi:hypothetical protein
MRRGLLLLAAGASALLVGGRSAVGASSCGLPQVGQAYTARVARVLASGRDVWGERLLSTGTGPSYGRAAQLLPPLLYAAGRGGRRLTASGVYYLPFAFPSSVGGARGFGLHVADGSQILVRRFDGPSMTVAVGATGRERFGSCLARLAAPALADGYLPMLQVSYIDGAGVRYRQESFVGRAGRHSLASFVRIVADATHASSPAVMRLATSRGGEIRQTVPRGAMRELDVVFEHARLRLRRVAPTDYAAARATVASFWQGQLAMLPVYDVPEPRVLGAERAVLIEELEMTWRYSVGNAYEELSFAEALDVAQVMAEFGRFDVARQILRYTLRMVPAHFTSWRAGERLVAGAQHFRLSHDVRYVDEETPGLGAVVRRLAHELDTSANGLLPRERYSNDIADEVYGLHSQTLAWQGLLAMGRVWQQTGHAALAKLCRQAAARLERGLRRVVSSSARQLRDRSLFVPASLLDERPPFRHLTATRDGTYWNLVVPYALASGFFAPHGAAATGLLRYLTRHGSRVLGLVRAGAYRLAPADPSFSGTDQVYGVNVARFLADNDAADQLVLSLYGTLAAGLTRGTYVAGEAASVTPLHGERYRTMYLPPNNDGAAAYLETLHSMLVHETRRRDGAPRGLELAFATPRQWLDPGKSISVNDAPTSFGPVSFSIARDANVVRLRVAAPSAPAPATLQVRLRLPAGERIAAVELDGEALPFDRRTATIDLSGRRGELQVVAFVGSEVRR